MVWALMHCGGSGGRGRVVSYAPPMPRPFTQPQPSVATPAHPAPLAPPSTHTHTHTHARPPPHLQSVNDVQEAVEGRHQHLQPTALHQVAEGDRGLHPERGSG